MFDKHTKYVKIEGKKLPDISDLLDLVAERNIDPTVFVDLEEGDIPKAPNCAKFFLSRKFMNLKPLPRQLQICLDFFEEYCVAGNTRVFTSKGAFEIQELCPDSKSGMVDIKNSFSISDSEGSNKVSRVGNLGTKPTKILQTEDGRELIGTLNQEVKVLTPDLDIIWKRMDNIQEGDYVLVKLGNNVWSERVPTFGNFVCRKLNKGRPPLDLKVPLKLTKELARFLGYLIGDGNIDRGYVLSFDVKYGKYSTSIKRCIESCFPDAQMEYYTFYDKKFNSREKLAHIQVSGKKICDFLTYIGANKGLAYTEEVPWCIWQAPKSYVVEFLSGLFEANGSYSADKIRISFNNRKLVSQIQHLLDNLGIKSKVVPFQNKHDHIRYSKKRKKNDIRSKGARLTILGEGIPRFLKLMTLDTKKPFPLVRSTSFGYDEGIPFVSDSLCALEKTKPSYHYKLKKPVRPGVTAQYNKLKRNNTSFYSYLKEVDIKLYSKVRNLILLVKTGTVFRKVISVKKHKNIKVYDVTVPKTSSFLGNGIVVHNCPKCSDPKLVGNMFDQPLPEILDRVQLLNYGICPKCGATKWDLHQQGYFHFPHTLAGCAGQRCVVGDTLVQTSHGFFEIGSFSEDRPYGFSDINLKLFNGEVFDKASKFFISKQCKVRKIKTRYTGIELGCSLDHPIKIFKNNNIIFQKAKYLEEGTPVVITYGQNIWPTKIPDISYFEKHWNNSLKTRNPKVPTKMTKDLARLLGYVSSEGHFGRNDVSFSNYNKNLIRDFSSLSTKLFGSSVVDTRKDIVYLRSKKVYEFLIWLGAGGTSAAKQVPWCILQSPFNLVCSYLQAYFEGDGGLEGRSVSCTSVSKKLIRQIRTLLLNIGIITQYKQGIAWATNGTENQIEKNKYVLYIVSPYFLKLFKENIGFLSDKKSKALQKAIDWYANKRVNKNPFFYEYLEPLNEMFLDTCYRYKNLLRSKNFRQGKHKNIAKDRVGFDTVFGGSRAGVASKFWRVGSQGNLTKNILKLFVDGVLSSRFFDPKWDKELTRRIDFFKYVVENNIYFDRISDIEESKEVTYDFYIPKTHQFWTEGVVSHNSGKSMLVDNFILPYILHRYLTTGRRGMRMTPQNYFGLLPTTIFQITATALTVTKALELIWNPFAQTIKRAPWFQSYHEFLEQASKEKGEPLYLEGSTFFFYTHKLISGGVAAPDFGKLRGPTRIADVVDEIDFFDTDEESKKQTLSAEEISKSLTNSLRTVRNRANKFRKTRPHWLSAYHIEVSSPSSVNGKILRDIRKAATSATKRVFGFHYCISGDNLITTEKGVIRIDDLGKKIAGGNTQNLELKVLGENGKVIAKEWHYTGKKDILEINLWSGHQINVSKSHKVKVLRNNQYEWLPACKIKEGDFLCVKQEKLTRKTRLPLTLTPLKLITDSPVNKLKAPKHMTPELAFILGALVSEGSFDNKRVCIPNQDIKYLNKIQDAFAKVFSYQPVMYGGYAYNPKMRYLIALSKALPVWFKELGITPKTAAYKRIPWSILQADEESQLSFIASYIEGDGWVSKGRIGIGSKSTELLRELQVLIGSHGIMTRISNKGHNLITISTSDYLTLFGKIKKHLVSKKQGKFKGIKDFGQTHKGFPFDSLRAFFISRKIKESKTACLGDTGETIELSNCSYYDKDSLFHNKNRTIFSYTEYKVGRFNGILKDLKRISPSEYRKIMDIVRLNYWHFPVVSIKNIGKQDTYDLTICKETPAFLANGVVVHNSTWEMNPDYTFEDFEEEFEDNPVKAWRDFGAVPPLAGDNPFFENVDTLKKSQRSEYQDLLSYSIKYHTDKFQSTTLYAEVKVNYTDNIPRLLTIDKGHSVNSFSLMLSHLEPGDKPTVDFVITVRPEKEDRQTKRIKINTHLMFEHAIKPILENLRITHVVYDRWESLDSVRKIRDEYEIEADQYSLQPKDFEEKIRPLINEVKGISYPKACITLDRLDVANYSKDFGGVEDVMKQAARCPVSTLMIQMLTVREAGRKIIKPLNGDDDAFRTLCLAIVYLLNTELNWKFKGTGKQRRARQGTRMGAVLGYSSGSGGNRSGMGNVPGIGRCVLATNRQVAPGNVKTVGGNMGRIAKRGHVDTNKPRLPAKK